MTQPAFARGQPCFSGEFTLFGKPRLAPHRAAWLRSLSAALVAMALAGPAFARPELGPDSSASVAISLSVAPKYGLRIGGLPARTDEMTAPGRLCMATNAQPETLPVLLVETGPGSSGQAGEQLLWCALDGSAAVRVAKRGAGATTARLLIIRPE